MTGFVFNEKPIQIERGEGAYLYDDSGREYLDMGASYAASRWGTTTPPSARQSGTSLPT